MPNTYVALRTETVAVATNSVTINLSGISGYTDLVLVINAGSSAGADANFRLNGDSGSNYSRTLITGNGSTATSSRTANALVGRLNANAYPNGGAGDTTIIAHFMNYANTTTFKTVISRANNAGLGTDAVVNLWRNTAAITSIEILSTSAATYVVGSTFSLYGIANADQGSAKATGGIITEDSQYWYHTFGASGAFIPKQSLTCDVLVVAGGGGGGSTTAGSNTYAGGGGGAGGFRTAIAQSLTATTYNVTVGGGGAGGASGAANNGTAGSNSVFNTITSTGGGFGARGNLSANNGGDGGSGGASTNGGTGGAASPSGQGSAGASSVATYGSSGGGGGASAAGSNVTTTQGGNGGNGTANSYSGFSVTYAGGGGGGSYNNATGSTGGTGGGGNGGGSPSNTGVAGTAGVTNTGGGGGGQGGGASGGTGGGGAGGSGVVIIRYSK